ncbi:MAG: hypothetical protein PHR82_06930 [Endomicrobiaceae bacterium]|nr:hypothetical protein [Endomicrobiaceae bacterium]
MERLNEHKKAMISAGYEWVGLFLQGSQNYNLDYENSDIDSKVIVLPSFENFVLNNKPVSFTHVMENEEHVDFKDIRLMIECFYKQNVNFVEILFTKYRILNPKYESIFQKILDIRERIGRYNNYATVNCISGMALEKQKALCHPYPSLIEKIEKYGYDSKQLHHILRMDEFLDRWIAGEPYEECLISKKRDYLKDIKRSILPLDEAVELANETVEKIKTTKNTYMETHPLQIDKEAKEYVNTVLVELMKFCLRDEIVR